MRTSLKALLILCTLGAVAYGLGWLGLQTPAGIQMRVTDSVVKVVVTEWDKEAGMQVPYAHGTGAFIDWYGSILTAAHLVENHPLAFIRYGDRQIAYARVAMDAKKDLAILVPVHGRVHTWPLFLGDGAAYGDRIYVVGYPGPMPQIFATGYVVGWDRGRIFVSAPIASGSSGGPILSSFVTIVGVIRGYPKPEDTSEAWQGYTFGPYVGQIKPFIEAWRNGTSKN